MYLAISAVAAMCAALAAVQTRNASAWARICGKRPWKRNPSADCADDGGTPAHRGGGARSACGPHYQAGNRLRESEDTACRLRQELQTERRKFKELQEELDAAKDAHDAAIGAMWSARNEVDNLGRRTVS